MTDGKTIRERLEAMKGGGTAPVNSSDRDLTSGAALQLRLSRMKKDTVKVRGQRLAGDKDEAYQAYLQQMDNWRGRKTAQKASRMKQFEQQQTQVSGSSQQRRQAAEAYRQNVRENFPKVAAWPSGPLDQTRTQALYEGSDAYQAWLTYKRQADHAYQAAMKTVQEDQSRGVKRTAQELSRQIDALELQIYDAQLDQMSYQQKVDAGQAPDITAMQGQLAALQARKAGAEQQSAIQAAEHRISGVDDETRGLLREYNEIPALAIRPDGGGGTTSRYKIMQKLLEKGYTEDEVRRLAEYEQRLQDYETYTARVQDAQDFGQRAPVFSTIVSAAAAPFKALGNLESLRGVLPKGLGGYENEGLPTNVYSPLYGATHVSSGIRGGVMQDMGATGQFLYQAGTSALDSAVNMAVSVGLMGAAGLSGEAAQGAVAETMNWVMGSQVAADSVYEGIRSGKSNARALVDGIAEGAIEGITEKYSVGEIMASMLSGEAAWKKLMRSFISEGGEEIASNWLNRLYDAAAHGKEHALRQGYEDKRKDGMSESQAFWSTVKEMAAEDALSFLAGGISGVAMAGTYEVTNKVAGDFYENESRQELRAWAEQLAQVQDEQAKAAAQAVIDKVNAGQTPTVEETANLVTELAAHSAEEPQRSDYETYAQYIEEREKRAKARAEEQRRARQEVYQQENAGSITGEEAERQLDAIDADEGQTELVLADEEAKAAREGADFLSNGTQEQADYEARSAENERQAATQSVQQAGRKAGYSEQTQAVMLEGYEAERAAGRAEADGYIQGFEAAYQYGKNGMSLAAAQKAAQGLTAQTVRAAWTAGKETAGNGRAGSEASYDGGKRNAGMDSGKPGRGVAGGAGQTGARAQGGRSAQAGLELGNRVRAENVPQQSGRDLGIQDGSAKPSFREVPQRLYTQELTELAAGLKAAGATQVHFIVGSIGRENTRAHVTRYADGLTRGTEVWIQADSSRRTAREIAQHEEFHLRADTEQDFFYKGVTALTENLTDAQIREMADRYAEAYEGCYDEADKQAIMEEMLADAFAGINRRGAQADRYTQLIRDAVGEPKAGSKKTGETRGPPEKYSIYEAEIRSRTQDEITAEYQNAVHGILNGTFNVKGALLVGYTPEIYRKLGMPNLPFVVGSGHVYSIAKTQDEAKTEGRFRKNTNYHGLGERAVADILQAVKNPVMVISAKDVDRNATPLRSTHSVVALVDVGTDGKSLVVPVSITAQNTVDGNVMDVNMISSVYEKNARGLVNEAIAQFNSGENSIFYVTKKAATLAGEGVQFPSILQAAATSSDGIVRKLDSKINMSIENVTQSKQFKRWFGDWQNKPETASKVVNADGTPKLVYHQTGNDFTIFDVRKNGAGTRDNETPFGIFLKSSSRDIGLNGKKQMALYVNIRNPLYAQDRADLTRQFRELSPEYDAIRQEHAALDKEYKQKFEDAKRNFISFLTEWKKNHPGESSRSLYGTPEFERVFDAEDAVVEEWTSKADVLSVRAKEVLTDALKQAGYDGVILANDAGSWGRSTDAYIALSENQVKSATDNVGTFDRDNPDIRYSAAEDAPQAEGLSLDTVPKKAKDALERMRNMAAAEIQRQMDIPYKARQEVLKPQLDGLINEYLRTGSISQESIDRSFEKAYEQGREISREFYDQYKDIKDQMRGTKLTLSDADKADIADFDEFRKSAFGRLRIANEGGLPVDTAYQSLREAAPELFPAGITHPADQLAKMLEVSRSIEIVERTLDEAAGPNAEEAKRWARNDFTVTIENMQGALQLARRYAEARKRLKERNEAGRPKTLEDVQALYKELKSQRRTYERAMSKALLTEEDQKILYQLMRGERGVETLEGMENGEAIRKVFEAKIEYSVTAARIAEWKRTIRAQRMGEAESFLKDIDKAKDKALGIQLSRETMTRNNLDVFGEEAGAAINKAYFAPIRKAEAEAKRYKDQMRGRVKALELSRRVENGNVVSEAFAVQLLGEAEDNIRMLQAHPYIKERDGKSLQEWQALVQELWRQNPKLDQAKIRRGVETLREIYNELFRAINEVRVRNGYEPINYRSGYFPHFQRENGSGGIKELLAVEASGEDKVSDSLLRRMGEALGMGTKADELPTTIAGRTYQFKPGIRWFGNAQERLGFATAYDALEGFDRYIEGAAGVIYQTDNIQRLRAFANQIRYLSSDEGIREQVDEIRALEDVSEEDKQNRIDKLYESGRYQLGHYIQELDDYTNLLANKKSQMDRGVERQIGRRVYRLAKGLEGRVAANMVAINPGSWLTNFGVIAQASAELKSTSILKAMQQTLAAQVQDDGFIDKSAFLTNRQGSEALIQSVGDRVSKTLSTPMELIDMFSASTIVRARYMENLQRGMTEADAIDEADQFAADVMAERSRGGMPTLFESKNPLIKLFTQFQLEVNNTFSYIFKDVPRRKRKEGILRLTMAIFKFVINSWIFNEIYEKLVGRRPQLDPINLITELAGDATGTRVNNLLDWGKDGIATQGEANTAMGTIENFGQSLAEELPFIGNLAGGGKLPMASSLPSFKNISNAIDSEKLTDGQKARKIGEEIAKPAAYWLPPFGGGQALKLWRGIEAYKKGGSYTADGRLQYPVYTDRKGDKAEALTRTLLFGKSATEGAKAWVEGGFGALSERATKTYEAMREAGIDQRDSFALIKRVAATKKTDDASETENRIRVIQEADVSDEAKALCYYGMVADESEQEKMDAYMQAGMDMGDYVDYREAERKIEGVKDSDGKTISGSKKQQVMELLTDSDFTEEQKTMLFEGSNYTAKGFEPWTQNYRTLYKAVSTGKNLVQTLQSLKSAGYEEEQIREAITDAFRQEYVEAGKEARMSLRGYLRNAFVRLGLSEKKALNKIDAWVEEKEDKKK